VIYKMSDEWRTNTARGGTTMRCDPDEELTKLLRATADAVGDGILGIDVLESKDGRYLVNEVNHTPEFHGALEVLSVDLVGAYVDFASRKLGIGAAA
jgi:[lysine-biosynthesis-protein LysW]--L-2-aminoadipate ligase